MPEEFEAETQDLQEEQPLETVEAESEAPPETNTKPRHIPFERFEEVYADLKAERAGREQLQHQIFQMQQQLLAASKAPAPPEPKVDPEIDELISPILNKRLAPYEQRIAQMQQREAAMWAEREASNAWDYVKSNVKDLDELAPDMQSYLASLPSARANKITSDPDLVIQTAELVRAMKLAGKSVGVTAAKQDLKQRTKSDSGTASPSPSNLKDIDWSDPNLDFDAMEAKIEAQRRKAGR